jgi:hypothetical protein
MGSGKLRGRWCHMLKVDDSIAGSTTSWAQEWHGVESIVGSRRTMVLWAWKWHGVDGVAGLGTTPTWSTASSAWVGEDSGTNRRVDRV